MIQRETELIQSENIPTSAWISAGTKIKRCVALPMDILVGEEAECCRRSHRGVPGSADGHKYLVLV